MEAANTLTYYDMGTITTLKSFIVQAPVDSGEIETLNLWQHIQKTFFQMFFQKFLKFAALGLFQTLDGDTNPKYKLLHFLTNKIAKKKRH
jgi:hypothetical protein